MARTPMPGGRCLGEAVRGARGLLGGSAEARPLGHQVTSVVARPDQRTRLDMLEAERQRLVLHLRELGRVVVALQRQMLLRWAEVLADGQDVAVDSTQVDERL